MLRNVRVARKRREAVDVCSFELVDPDGEALPSFTAGSHIDVHGPLGHVRQYSLCNDPSERHRYLIAVLRDARSRGGSQAMHDAVQEGDILRISAPRNLFSLTDDAQEYRLLAGGIGVTPILCMAEELTRRSATFQVHYFARSRARAAFLDRIHDSPFATAVNLHFDDEKSTSQLADIVSPPGSGAHLYVCGPEGFLEAVCNTAYGTGWRESNVHVERFAPEQKPVDGDTPFRVRLASSGQEIEVPVDRSVVSALAEHGIEIPVSCEQGICGTCLTRVLDGEPDHRDSYLTPDEHRLNDCFTPCCSRSRSPVLVLDL